MTQHDLIDDLGTDGPVQLGHGERLWKVYIFRPASGRSTQLEHRIYFKLKPDGRLAMVTFAAHRPVPQRSVRSGIVHVRDLTLDHVAQIIRAMQQQAATDEFEVIDFSEIPSLDQQIEHLHERLTRRPYVPEQADAGGT